MNNNETNLKLEEEIFEKDCIEEQGEESSKVDDNQNVATEVICVINDIVPTEVKDSTNNLADDLGMDSLGMIILLTMIEDSFGIELDESDMNPFALRTVQDVIDLVAKYCRDQTEEVTDG